MDLRELQQFAITSVPAAYAGYADNAVLPAMSHLALVSGFMDLMHKVADANTGFTRRNAVTARAAFNFLNSLDQNTVVLPSGVSALNAFSSACRKACSVHYNPRIEAWTQERNQARNTLWDLLTNPHSCFAEPEKGANVVRLNVQFHDESNPYEVQPHPASQYERALDKKVTDLTTTIVKATDDRNALAYMAESIEAMLTPPTAKIIYAFANKGPR